jgi:L-amino acid N-acyltransferase YncA
VSVYLAEGGRGRGIGRKLLSELLERLTEAGFVNAFAGIALPNSASVGLFEAFGFERIAQQKNVGFKLGAWRDVGWWQLQLRDPTVPPPRLHHEDDEIVGGGTAT